MTPEDAKQYSDELRRMKADLEKAQAVARSVEGLVRINNAAVSVVQASREDDEVKLDKAIAKLDAVLIAWSAEEGS